MKKILSIILSITMLFSMSAIAFAEETTTSGAREVESNYLKPGSDAYSIQIEYEDGTIVKNSLSITEIDGNIKTLYAQLATTNVKKGDEITAKQSIGTVGKTGNATGAHLHYEVMVDGKHVDPSAYMK